MEHKNNFNFMRLIFGVMVVYSHSFGLLALKEPTIFNRAFGNFAVHCFFALSGYLITTSFLKSKVVIDFAYKRALRLLPAFIVACFLGNFLASTCNGFINNPVPYIINGPVWTLSYEILAYIICALLGCWGLLNSNTLSSFWLVSLVLIIINVTNQSQTNQIIIPMLFLFLSGSFIAINEEQLKIKISGVISIIILSVIAIIPSAVMKAISILPWLYGANFAPETINYFIYLILLPISIIYIGKYLPFKIAIKNDISYGIYIYTWPIQQAIIYTFMKYKIPQSPLLLLVSSLCVSIIFSFISWKLIEKPLLSLKRINISNVLSNCTNKLRSWISI